jgi:tetratricopeptide (TPR) repeat protein
MRFHSLYLAVALISTSSAFADDVLSQAEALINQQQPAQAYELLLPFEAERSGDPKYDYLLGVSALEMGDPSNAIFAFERCLSAEPNNGPCRVQIARTHLAMGETPNARAELQTIKEYNPPPEVQALVSQYLGVISQVEKQQQRQINAFAQLGVGYDSNINSAPTDANKTAAAIPKTPNFIIPPNAIATSSDSSYANLLAGSSLLYKASPTVTALADINIQTRSFLADHNYDYQAVDASAGGAFDLQALQLTLKLQGQKMWLDGNAYRNLAGVLAQLQGAVGSGQMAVFTQLSQMRYDSQSVRDADRHNIGLAYSQAIEAHYSPSFYASIYGGSEAVTDKKFEQFSQAFKGLRFGGSLILNDVLSLNSQLSYEAREHNKASYYPSVTLLGISFPTVYREDKESNIGLSANWRINKQLSLQPSYTYSNNNSNIPFSDYKRHVVSVDLRFDM